MYYVKVNGQTVQECYSFNQALYYSNFIKSLHYPKRCASTGKYKAQPTVVVTIDTTGISPV